MRSLLKRPSSCVEILIDALEGRRMFAFGVTTGTLYVGGTTYNTLTIDNGSNLNFTVLKGVVSGPGSNTVHLGDVTSIKYKGTETLATYANASRFSHYEQGLGNITTTTTTIDPSTTPQWIKITCDDSAETSGGVVQTYVVKRGDDNLYMTSLPTDVNNGPGEGRFIAYLNRSMFTPEVASDNTPHSTSDVVSTIEGGDVFGHTDGTGSVKTTSSKFFNNGRRMIDNVVHGVTGTSTAIGAYMYMGNREHSAGGPFFKDIDFQSSATQLEIYNCIFTGHTQTEAYRQGLHVYAMQFTNGSAPVTPNYSFLEGLNIAGLVPAAARGAVGGLASGVPVGHESVVTLSNADAQYWTKANTSTGAYAISGVLPGTYTETLYDNELAVGTRTVTVSAGGTASSNIANTYYTPAATWRIGTWDGTPKEFLNADKIETQHPSDTRMASWVLPAVATNVPTDPATTLPTFIVGTNTASQFPLAQFMGVNNSSRIQFTLTAAQAAVAQTLRIGITWGFSGARPRITVNAGQTYAYTSTIPTASSDLDSRGITRGTWRGDNQLYTFPIPTSALKAGVNTIDIPLVSGSFTPGQTWLSPNVSYDAIDLVPTPTATAPAIASVTLTPVGSAIGVNGTRAFTAVAKDASGNVIAANLDWSAARGTIDSSGNYVAPATAGNDTVTVTAYTTRISGYNTTSSSTSAFGETISGTASTTVSVLTATPGVATAANGSPNPTGNRKTTLSVLGADLTGEANLKYTWTVVGTAPGPVTFSANGTNAAKSTVASFTTPGVYTFRATISNTSNLSTTSDTTVTILDKKAWYRVDESAGPTLVDSSGAGVNGTLNGTYAYTAGIAGNAIQYTGGYAKLPNGIVAGLDDFAVGAWVKPDSLPTAFARIFDFGSGTNSYMFLTPKSETGNVRFAIKTSSTSGEQVVNGPALAVGVWSHVVVTLTGNVATLYINGVAVGTNSAMTYHPAALGTTTNNLIAESQFPADPALLATVDDFRVYGTGLSAANVNAWYTAGVAPTVTGFVVNDGSSQRSMVNSIKLTFDQAVNLDATDLVLQINGVATATTLTVTPTNTANTSYVVTFSGSGTTLGSLNDARYKLVLVGPSITNAGGTAMASSPAYDFFRFFGDGDGNAAVDFNDFLQFQTSFGLSTGNAGYKAAFDSDGNGTIDFNDFLALQVSFGTSI